MLKITLLSRGLDEKIWKRETQHSRGTLGNAAFRAKPSRRRAAADDFDGKLLRRVSGKVALEYSPKQKAERA